MQTQDMTDAVKPAENMAEIAPALVAPNKEASCPTCSGSAPVRPPPTTGYIYVVGQIEPRFPKLSVEKEFAQATGQVDTAGLTDRQVLLKALTDPRNRHLRRQLCWVMTIAGIETYLVVPRQPADVDLLVDSLRSAPDSGALDAVIGTRGPVAPPEMCNGLTLPIVFFDQLYSFDRDSLLKSIPKPANVKADTFANISADLLDQILSATDNAGATDEHRAMNYLALRDPNLYAQAADCYSRDLALTSTETRPWRLSTSRKVVEILHTFTHRKNEFVEKYRTRVDVHEEFPFLVSKMTSYYDH